MFSVLLRPPVPPARLGWLPLLAGVALAESVGRIAMVDAGLKWPNDLLVAAAGSATTGTASAPGCWPRRSGTRWCWAIGLNVSQRADELPPREGAVAPATSLDLAGAVCTDRDPLLRADAAGAGRLVRPMACGGRGPGALAGCARRTGSSA